MLALIMFAIAGFFIEASWPTSKFMSAHVWFSTQLSLPSSCWYWVDSELVHGWSLFAWQSHDGGYNPDSEI